MRVLLLSRHCRIGASSRMRALQYLPYMQNQGIDVDVKPLYDAAYLNRLYRSGRRDAAKVLRRYVRRAFSLVTCGRYDLIWLEQEVFPWFPAWVEATFGRLGMPYVVDYDDAIFHRYDMHGQHVVRFLLGDKIDRAMRHAAMVVAGNRYLADRARGAGATRVEIVPTVVDLERYKIVNKKKAEPFTIGWIGSPTTFEYFLRLAPVLIALKKRYRMRVRIVGAAADHDNPLPFEFFPWTEASEVPLIRTFDVGIMPLPKTPWAKGKCGYKLIQYMACGLPVVASRVGANIDIVRHGRNGLLVSSPRQWFEAIERLYTQSALGRQMGRAARKTVERHYHLGITAPHLVDLFLQFDRSGLNHAPAPSRIGTAIQCHE